MRSSKSRSRSKSNRNRPSGNIVNRVFDSSGPEGKVRGTPQQIIDKYSQLARDAQLSGDRVAFENFQQHAEHYTRLLSEAQREQEARREQQERERERQQQNQQRREDKPSQDRGSQSDDGSGPVGASDVIDTGDDGGNLVETPENAESKPRRPRRKKQSQPSGDGDGSGEDASRQGDGGSDRPEAAE